MGNKEVEEVNGENQDFWPNKTLATKFMAKKE